MREQHGLPRARTDQQLELDLKADDTTRDLAHWSDDGYAAGVQGRECKPPAGIHPSFIPTWTEQWGEGQKERAWALAAPTPKLDSKVPQTSASKAAKAAKAAAAPVEEEDGDSVDEGADTPTEEDEDSDVEDHDPGAAFDGDEIETAPLAMLN